MTVRMNESTDRYNFTQKQMFITIINMIVSVFN